MIIMTNRSLGRFCGWLAAGLISTLPASPASAAPEPAQVNGSAFATGQSALAFANCNQARDAIRCLAMMQARDFCQAKRGAAKHRCLLKYIPAPDCSKAPDPSRCLALREAHLACKGKPGREQRKCLRQSVAIPP